MAQVGQESLNDGDDGVSDKPRPGRGGVQLPMELSFITVEKPGQRIPYWQLSQITAHAMRKSHERRRGIEGNAPQLDQLPPQQAPQVKRTKKSAKDTPRDSTTTTTTKAKPAPSSTKRYKSQKEEFLAQQSAFQTHPLSTSAAAKRSHLKPAFRTQTPPTERKALDSDGVLSAVLSHDGQCDCSQCHLWVLSRSSANAFSDKVFGGLRTDPFVQYPIPFQNYFPAAVDHCRQVVVPDPAFFRLIVTHDVLFEAVLTWVLCTTLSHDPEIRKAMFKHYGNTLSKIRARLLSRGSMRRAVMASISNLAGVCAYIGDESSFAMHRTALEHIAEFNDDQDLGQQDNTAPRRKSKFHDALSSAQPRTRNENNVFDNNPESLYPTASISNEPVYPSLPFPAELSKLISGLPEGFRELALKRMMSIQLIERVGMDRSQIVRLASRAPMDRENSKALRSKFTPLERLVWLAFSVFHLCTVTYKPDREELAQAFIECSRRMIHGSKAENECLLWGGCMVVTIQAIEDWELPQRQEATEILLLRFRMTIDQMNQIAQKFLWNETMGDGLTKILERRFVVVPKIEEGAEWRTFL